MNDKIFNDVDKWESGELGASAEHAVSVGMNPKLRHLLDNAKQKSATSTEKATVSGGQLNAVSNKGRK